MSSSLLQLWLRLQALIWLPLLVVYGCGIAAVPWPTWTIAIGISFVAVVAILRAVRTLADLVTIIRMAGLLTVAFAVSSDVPIGAWLSILALVLLDLVDGALARRFGATQAGAVLDMEADQFTVMLLALLIVRGGGAGYVLLVPAMRYAFVISMWLLQLPAHDPKPVAGDNRRGRLCCALVVTALLAALWPNMNALAADLLTAIAVLVLAWSFLSDARHLVSRLRSSETTA